MLRCVKGVWLKWRSLVIGNAIPTMRLPWIGRLESWLLQPCDYRFYDSFVRSRYTYLFGSLLSKLVIHPLVILPRAGGACISLGKSGPVLYYTPGNNVVDEVIIREVVLTWHDMQRRNYEAHLPSSNQHAATVD